MSNENLSLLFPHSYSPPFLFCFCFVSVQRLTYEEKMARRLLGADSAATVFNIQEPEEEPAIQVLHNSASS